MTHGNHPEQLIGSILAHRFAIESLAGEGGMGVVFKARDITDNRAVALKLLNRQSATATMSEPSRFFREAQLLSELRHPGIVSYVAHGQTSEGQLYLAMEWLSGHDLGKRLSQGTLSLTETLTLCRTIADALAAAHRVGIVHRDLKPPPVPSRNEDGTGWGKRCEKRADDPTSTFGSQSLHCSF